jgi:hypothetical protein
MPFFVYIIVYKSEVSIKSWNIGIDSLCFLCIVLYMNVHFQYARFGKNVHFYVRGVKMGVYKKTMQKCVLYL